MAELQAGMFGKYELTAQEELQSALIQPMMKYRLQNLLSAAAEELIEIRTSSNSEAQEELRLRVVYLQARIDFIKELQGDDAQAAAALEDMRSQHAQQERFHPDQGNVMRIFSAAPTPNADSLASQVNQAVDFNKPISS